MSRKVVVFETNTREPVIKDIGDKLKDLQREVGGSIQIVYASEEMNNMNIDLFVNEEGKLIGLPVSGYITSNNEILDLLVGNLLFTGHDDEGNTISLTDEQVEYVENLCKDSDDIIVGNRFFINVVRFNYQ